MPFVLLLLLAACDLETTAPQTEDFVQWHGFLVGEGEFELTGESGMAWVEGTGRTVAGIEIDNDEPGARRPWFIRLNSCAEGGDVVGFETNYDPLEINGLGTAEANSEILVAADTAATYHVSVHQSATDPERIACATLEIVAAP